MLIGPDAGRFVLGDRVQLKLGAAETAGAFSCLLGFTPPGKGPPLHRHEHEDECFCVLAGTYEMIRGARRVRLGAGDSIFLPRRVAHTFVNVGSRPGRLLELVVPGGLEDYFDAVNVLGPELDAGLDGRREIARLFGISFPEPGAHAPQDEASAPLTAGIVLAEAAGRFPFGISVARWTMPSVDACGRLATIVLEIAPGTGGGIDPVPSAWRLLFLLEGAVDLRDGSRSAFAGPGALGLAGDELLAWENVGPAPARLLLALLPRDPGARRASELVFRPSTE
ncbi:MAG TPA: cupin domain-containing protein [Gaiellaceae bacterium]|nr:cupin domain-containing protein [Gaiellaceae bacterium]